MLANDSMLGKNVKQQSTAPVRPVALALSRTVAR